jgi:sec-independent protein translocase protein TatB
MLFGDISIWKLLVLGLIAFFVFGPDRLPELARDAGRMLRQLRKMASDAKSGLKDQFPEAEALENIDLTLLNPKAFVRKHLFEDDPMDTAVAETPRPAPAPAPAPATPRLREGERAPFDPDAT